jgi:hypothetical protein
VEEPGCQFAQANLNLKVAVPAMGPQVRASETKRRDGSRTPPSYPRVAGWRPFLLLNASKKEKVPKRKKFNPKLYFS